MRAFQSTDAPATEIPRSFACPISEKTSAVCNRTFVGMHPTFRHVPPIGPFSINVTFAPSCAARIAATYPPGPPPMTDTRFSDPEAPFSIFSVAVRGGSACCMLSRGPSSTSPLTPMTAIGAETGTDCPAGTRICKRTPSSWASTSNVSLSVATTRSTSPLRTESPTFFLHSATFPSVIVRPSFGMSTCCDMYGRTSLIPVSRNNEAGSRPPRF